MMKAATKWKPDFYNEKHSFVYHYGEELIKLLNPKPNERILDLGCGSGQLTFKISQLARETVGIDKSEEMIADAKSRYPEIEFQVADAGNFKFEKQFDAIFSNATLHWVLDYQSAIQCMYDSLKPGGRMVVEFGGKENVQTIIDQLRSVLHKRGYISQSELVVWYFPSLGEYTAELKSFGFRVVLAEHFDRTTELADEKSGIIDWLSMFGDSFFTEVAQHHKEEIKQEVQENVRDKCLSDGKWYADYKRLRISATKE